MTAVSSPALPRAATAYLAAIAAAAGLLGVPLLARLGDAGGDLSLFVALAACAAVAQVFVVNTPRDQAYHTTVVFLLPAVLLLPPEWIPLLAIVQHVPEWLKERYPWYIAAFNICNNALDLLAAYAVAHAVAGSADSSARVALAGAAAAVTYVLTNHLLLAVMLRLARGHSFRESGLFETENVATDLALASLGVTLATVLGADAWLAPVALAPLFLVHRSLAVPALEEEARVDPKTGLFNVRHFGAELREELARSIRYERPFAVLMADLDLLRDINNTHGHLAGDAVMREVADVFRREVRHYDVPARFGGEEFAVLLPEIDGAAAEEIAERIRRGVEQARVVADTSSEPIGATISVGVAAFPADGADANAILHAADVAVYAAKAGGRNRVVRAHPQATAASSVPVRTFPAAPAAESPPPAPPRPAAPAEPHRPVPSGPRLFSMPLALAALVVAVAAAGIAAGAAAFGLSGADPALALAALVALVAGGQALALELEGGTISVSVVGAIAGAAIAGPRAALPLAVAVVAVQWSATRAGAERLLFNVGALTLAALAAAGVFAVAAAVSDGPFAAIVAGLLAGVVYYGVNAGLLSAAMALEDGESWREVLAGRFGWLLPHYAAFGAAGAAMALAYDAIELWGLLIFALPLVLIRVTMASYLRRTQENARELRVAADTIRAQNVSLEQANRELVERTTAAMESLAAAVDARDAYTAGHSRRVQQLALAVGTRMRLGEAELEHLGHAALFHDIGKLAVPDSVLLKPARLTDAEWETMRRHADDGAHIIGRLSFLADAVPAIRHHHERYDGSGYPDGLAGEDIPLAARIIHVADAVDSMISSRVYRSARPMEEALAEVRAGSGRQFCPACVAALEDVFATGGGVAGEPLRRAA